MSNEVNLASTEAQIDAGSDAGWPHHTDGGDSLEASTEAQATVAPEICDLATTHQCFDGVVVAYVGSCGNSREWLRHFDGGLPVDADAAAETVPVMRCPFGCLGYDGDDIINLFDPTPEELYRIACQPRMSPDCGTVRLDAGSVDASCAHTAFQE